MKSFLEWLKGESVLLEAVRYANAIVCQRCGYEEEEPFNSHQFDRGEYRCPKCGGPFDFKTPKRKHPGGLLDPDFHGRREYKEVKSVKGAPTSLNIWVMYNSLEKGGGVISDRVEPTSLSHLRRCLEAGFLERGGSGGFVPTQKGIEAMEKEFTNKMSRDPSYKRPAWMGVGSDASQ